MYNLKSNKMFKSKSSTLLTLFCILSILVSESFAQNGARVNLQSNRWKFNISHTPQSSISKNAPRAEFITANPTEGFTLKMDVNLSSFDGEVKLLDIDSVAHISMRRAGLDERNRQNYPAFKMPDGSIPVLEASIILRREDKNNQPQKMVIGYPLAMLKNSYGKHEVILNFDGIKWTMYVDKELVDNDFAIGYPKWNANAGWSINPRFVENAEVFTPAIKPMKDTPKESAERPQIQYWTPTGHNSWVGDVATLYQDGRFHVFYLYDRRHHASKLGVGGHYFEHLSTTDFKNWTEHEAATPIEEQWETFGTGTPFVWNGKLHIAYGLHTSRIYPDEKNMSPSLKAYYDNYKKTGFFDYTSFPNFPSGTTYSVSQDGVSNFVKSKKIVHYSENPAIYVDPNGKLTMLASFRAKGMWQTDSLDGGWHCVNETFPPGGDCTFFFRWGKYDYIIGGFVDLWKKSIEEPETKYKSVVAEGEDFYNGFNVPAITEISNNRFIMSGWLPIRGWGGPLLIHELVQQPSGRIGTKWMEELIPEKGIDKTIAKELNDALFFTTKEQSFMLTFDVTPTDIRNGKLAVSFLPTEGTTRGCEFQLRLNDLVAQYSDASFDGYANPEKSLRQGGQPQSVGNYAIEKLTGVDNAFRIRIIVKQTDKFGGALIDSEIASQRTMVTFRPDLIVEKLMFKSEGLTVKNINIAPLK